MDNELREWTAYRGSRTIPSASLLSNHQRYAPPSRSFVYKLLCDGSFNYDTQKAGIGVLMFNVNGQTIDGRAGRAFCRAPICAEALAIHTAVLLATRTNSSSIVLSDCAQLVAAIKDDDDQWPWECAATIASIRRLLDCYGFITIQHCRRGEVAAADRIAKDAREGVLAPDWLTSVRYDSFRA
ncbi:hypothetical protein LINPERPRIM_LOCUS18984 [Linum perenne]